MKVAIVIFDDFTDIDLFLMWDVLGRPKFNWEVKILGANKEHKSTNGLLVKTHGTLNEVSRYDVVFFSSGRGTRTVIQDDQFLNAINVDNTRQLLGSICSGALILAKLGLLKGITATTHLAAKQALIDLDVTVVDQPFVCHGNIATAGGCLSAQYLVAWAVETLYGMEKRKEVLKEIAPVGQAELYEDLVTVSIQSMHKKISCK